eukprot:8703341-Pyramimonas_sp.AAC.1
MVGNAPCEDNCLRILTRARAPYLGLQRRESTILVRPDNTKSYHNAVPGDSALRINATVAS